VLDRSKVAHELARMLDTIFVDVQPQYELAFKVWQQLAGDELFKLKVRTSTVPLHVPTWHESLTQVHAIASIPSTYTVIGIDGSQVYPDRHQGLSCFLINTGTVVVSYGGTSKVPVIMRSEPRVFGGDQLECALSIDLVNALRQQFEFEGGIAAQQLLDDAVRPALVLLDGSLIFWHLETKDKELKNTFLARYETLLEEYKRLRIPMASYISAPKSRELSNLVRLKLANCDSAQVDAYKVIEKVHDAGLCRYFLAPGERTIVFGHQATLQSNHLSGTTTHFFYLHTGTEIGRVEIPSWIATDQQMVNSIAATIFDQCIKGHGYPIVLAEAHEQAVVKGQDRDFFFHLLSKKAFDYNYRCGMSTKAIRKRSATV
jgi:hypothetical protein